MLGLILTLTLTLAQILTQSRPQAETESEVLYLRYSKENHFTSIIASGSYSLLPDTDNCWMLLDAQKGSHDSLR